MDIKIGSKVTSETTNKVNYELNRFEIFRRYLQRFEPARRLLDSLNSVLVLVFWLYKSCLLEKLTWSWNPDIFNIDGFFQLKYILQCISVNSFMACKTIFITKIIRVIGTCGGNPAIFNPFGDVFVHAVNEIVWIWANLNVFVPAEIRNYLKLWVLQSSL